MLRPVYANIIHTTKTHAKVTHETVYSRYDVIIIESCEKNNELFHLQHVNKQDNRTVEVTTAAWLAVMFAYVSSKMDEFNINVGLYFSLQQLSI